MLSVFIVGASVRLLNETVSRGKHLSKGLILPPRNSKKKQEFEEKKVFEKEIFPRTLLWSYYDLVRFLKKLKSCPGVNLGF